MSLEKHKKVLEKWGAKVTYLPPGENPFLIAYSLYELSDGQDGLEAMMPNGMGFLYGTMSRWYPHKATLVIRFVPICNRAVDAFDIASNHYPPLGSLTQLLQNGFCHERVAILGGLQLRCRTYPVRNRHKHALVQIRCIDGQGKQSAGFRTYKEKEVVGMIEQFAKNEMEGNILLDFLQEQDERINQICEQWRTG